MNSDVVFDSNETKSIVMSANAFQTLKNNLINNMGVHKSKGFLFRFGKEFGIDSAKKSLRNQDKGEVGKRHARVGHVKDVIFKGKIVQHPDGRIECIDTWGQWIESFEAALHVQQYGISEECVCHMLCGFASGALSYEYGKSIIVLERKCVAKGDAVCEFEVRLEEDWHGEMAELVNLYQNDNILSELEMTYDSLLQHKQMLEKISIFQSQLTQKVTEKYSLDEIILAAYNILQIPIVIEDIHQSAMSKIGLTDEQYRHIKESKNSLQRIELKDHSSIYQGDGYMKLITPVYLNKRNYASCAFYYFEGEKQIQPNDDLFLGRVAMVVALCILYEEVQFEEQQRMRSSLLERLIHLQNPKDIESYCKFLPFKLQPPFLTGIIHIDVDNEADEFIDLHDQIAQLSRLTKKMNISCIFTVIGEEIAVLKSQYIDKLNWKQKNDDLFDELQALNKSYRYSIGLSDMFTSFDTFEQSLREAQIAQKFPNKQRVTYYNDLGILGELVTNLTEDQLHTIAKKTLKGLYDFNDIRKRELLHTLYTYLMNGQRLKETMEELMLSIGGVQYRVKQIEEYLQTPLKNASAAAYILLIIQALILTEQLHFDEFI